MGTSTARRGGAAPPSGEAGRRWRGRLPWLLAAGVAVAMIAAAVIAGAGGSPGGTGTTAAEAEFGHVHGLAVDPATSAVHVATHHGLFRITGQGSATRVSREALDLMGFTVAASGHFLASGHPDEHGDGPANLGLIESRDGGVTWRSISLGGAADFHGLHAAHDRVYGYDSGTATFMVSTDRQSWDRRSTLPMAAFTVSPTDPDTVVAVTRDGIQRSTDGGRSWQPTGAAPPLVRLAWQRADQLWGVDAGGTVWLSGDAGDQWQRRGSLPAAPQALAAAGGALYAAVEGDLILASTDGGSSWGVRYRPS